MVTTAVRVSEPDLHAPYLKDAKDNGRQRRKNSSLSPDAYGNALLQYVKAMKAVDSRISVGAALDLPLTNQLNVEEVWTQDPNTKEWKQGPSNIHKDSNSALDWDRNVLKVAVKNIDFVALHWYRFRGFE